MLAGRPVPAIPPQQSAQTYYHSGTVTDNYGGSARYSGTSYAAPSGGFAGGFASGMSSGMAMGMAMQAQEDRRIGGEMMNWLSSHWLRTTYTIKPNAAVAGILEYPTSGRTPLQLKVSVGDRNYSFKTAAIE
jgi:hypothetical protein